MNPRALQDQSDRAVDHYLAPIEEAIGEMNTAVFDTANNVVQSQRIQSHLKDHFTEMFKELKEGILAPNNNGESSAAYSVAPASKREKNLISGDIRRLFREMNDVDVEVQEEDLLFYVFSETFESRGNQKVTDKLVK